MRFLSVAERELRAAARNKGMFHIRWITATAFFALLVWLIWVFGGFRNRLASPQVFSVFSVLTFFYCLIIGAIRTADCLSSEKREGTLGLLFLSNLKSVDIIAGKFCSSALAAVYGLFAIFPMLALPLLMGGITFGHFWRTIFALVNAIVFSVAAGFVASALCVRQFTAVALATGLALFGGAGLMAVAGILYGYSGSKIIAGAVGIFCPLYTLISAEGGTVFGRAGYWVSLAAVSGISWTWLALVTWRLGKTWRDRPKRARWWNGFTVWQRWRQRGSAERTALRRRLLEINPFFWLDSRRRLSSPIFMLMMVVVAVATVEVMAPLFGRVLGGPTPKPLEGFVFAWLWTGLAIHALVLYYAAMVASRRLAEDRETGALELILCTPTTERLLSRGLWLAYGRKMFFPATAAILVHLFFIWQGATLLVMEAPSGLPSGIQPGQLLWHALLNQPVPGQKLDWQFAFALRLLLLALALAMLIWFTLGWVGRWLGLRMKHAGFAPMTALALVLFPPVVTFSFLCYLSDVWGLVRMPERQFLPLMMWVAFAIGVAHCLLLSAWAAGRLRRDFRAIVMSRFQPLAVRPWWRPSRRFVLRLAIGTAALVVALVSITLSFYGYQNWRSKRAWAAFQKELRQKGESLEVAALLPGPVPEAENFARAPVFRSLLNAKRADTETARLFDRLKQFETANSRSGNIQFGMEWIQQGFVPLDDCLKLIAQKSGPVTGTNRGAFASAVLYRLQAEEETLRALASAARLPFFQVSTNRTALAVILCPKEEISALERLHFLFQVRASALLMVNRTNDASDDLLIGLRLASLARQMPDAKSPIRVQCMLARSLQPLWEGLATHQWSDAQLSAFQKVLAEFNLLADHTNAVRRAVLADIEAWRAIPNAEPGQIGIPSAVVGYRSERAWRVQPRGWWFDNCIQLYQAGQKAIERVDVAGARVQLTMDWSDISGLPLDNDISELLQQGYWWGANPAQVAFAQTAVNQAIIACALERYRLAHGAFPETLDKLIPVFLSRIPNDIIRGSPMLFQRTDDAHFILRSVGPNGIDDRKQKGSDDWLWSFPTNAPPAAL